MDQGTPQENQVSMEAESNVCNHSLLKELRDLAETDAEIDECHSTIANLTKSILHLSKVVAENRLEEKWCYDVRDKSKRIRPHPESEASRIAVQLGEHPHLTDDVITELQKKKVSLTLEVARLEDELKQSSVS